MRKSHATTTELLLQLVKNMKPRDEFVSMGLMNAVFSLSSLPATQTVIKKNEKSGWTKTLKAKKSLSEELVDSRYQKWNEMLPFPRNHFNQAGDDFSKKRLINEQRQGVFEAEKALSLLVLSENLALQDMIKESPEKLNETLAYYTLACGGRLPENNIFRKLHDQHMEYLALTYGENLNPVEVPKKSTNKKTKKVAQKGNLYTVDFTKKRPKP